jgi:hypothetical protein
MSYNFVIYCKTFSRDFERVKNLFASIQKYNKDNIPFFISAPEKEQSLLQSIIGTEGYTFIADEEICQIQSRLDGWRQQQIVKSNFWKGVDTQNYLCIDSDAFFIRDFYLKDFFYYDGTPYSLVSVNKEVQQYEKLFFNKNYSENGYVKAVKAYRDIFSNQHSKIWDFGPSPYLWSTKVWKSFEDSHLTPNSLSFEEFQLMMQDKYSIAMREAITYGEYLISAKPIEIYPTSGLFKVYHWKEMYEFEKITGLANLENLKENYLGIVLQANWS